MAENSTLYISNRELPPLSVFEEAAAGARIEPVLADNACGWEHLGVFWSGYDGVVLHYRDLTDPEMPRHLNGFCGYAFHLVNRQMDQYTYKLIQKIQKVKHIVNVTPRPDFTPESGEFLRRIALATNAITFQDQAIFDSHGRLYLGPGNLRGEGAEITDLPSAVERKRRSEALLRQKGVRVLDSLPPVDADEEVVPRTPQEVARRAAALWAVAVRGEGLEQEQATAILKDAGLWDAASPAEQAFLDDPEPSEQDRIQFCWRYECLWVMLWALGHIDGLGLPEAICDVPRSAKLMLNLLAKPDEFVASAQLGPAAEILDLLDLTFRCHWATVDARAKGQQMPAGLEPGVTQERHQALNWLARARNEDWDDVRCDT